MPTPGGAATAARPAGTAEAGGGARKARADRGGRVDEIKVEGVDHKRKRRGIRMESALAMGGSRLSPPAAAATQLPDSQSSAQDAAAAPGPSPAVPPVAPRPEAERPPVPTPASERQPTEAAAARPSRPAVAERKPGTATAPKRPPTPTAGRPPAAALKRAVKAMVTPKRKTGVKATPEARPSRDKRRRAEPATSAETPIPAESPVVASTEPVPLFWGEWVRQQRRLIIAAAVGFLGGLFVYALFGPGEPAPGDRPAVTTPRRAPDRTVTPPAVPSSPSAGRAGLESGYRPPSSAPSYPPSTAYPSAPTYPPAQTYPGAPSYPAGRAYPTEDYRPWGRTDGRDERPREAPPGTLGGYPSAPSPYVPFSPGR